MIAFRYQFSEHSGIRWRAELFLYNFRIWEVVKTVILLNFLEDPQIHCVFLAASDYPQNGLFLSKYKIHSKSIF